MSASSPRVYLDLRSRHYCAFGVEKFLNELISKYLLNIPNVWYIDICAYNEINESKRLELDNKWIAPKCGMTA